MNFRLILNIMGYTLWVEAGCLLLPLLVSVGYGEACWEPFLWTLGLCSLCGLILTHIPARKNRLQGRDGYAVVAMAWIVLCLFGAVPYVLSGAVPHYADALFETASGLTTTGATILTDVEAMPRGILFWRALTQWMGGMGVLVLFLALMPWTGAGAVHLGDCHGNSEAESDEKSTCHEQNGNERPLQDIGQCVENGGKSRHCIPWSLWIPEAEGFIGT